MPCFYPLVFFCSVVLRCKNRKGVAEILDGQIGEGVYFYCGGKGGHCGAAEAVYQSLNCQNPKIHYGLLDTG